ncbi:hypothetical protein HDU93_002918 [Gonapodya sp. JEL0774]|nr:hypothetical protein HDU93_002918 [Gonapodya sp. JEL0774]
MVCCVCGKLQSEGIDFLPERGGQSVESFPYEAFLESGYRRTNVGQTFYPSVGSKRKRTVMEQDHGAVEADIEDQGTNNDMDFGGLLRITGGGQRERLNVLSGGRDVLAEAGEGTLLRGRMRGGEKWGRKVEQVLRETLTRFITDLNLGSDVGDAAFARCRRVFQNKELAPRFAGPSRGKVALLACIFLECGERNIALEAHRVADVLGLSGKQLLGIAMCFRREFALEFKKAPGAAYIERLVELLHPYTHTSRSRPSWRMAPAHRGSSVEIPLVNQSRYATLARPESRGDGDTQLSLTKKRRQLSQLAIFLYRIPATPEPPVAPLRAVASTYLAYSLVEARRAPLAVMRSLCTEVSVSMNMVEREVAEMEQAMLNKCKGWAPWAIDFKGDDSSVFSITVTNDIPDVAFGLLSDETAENLLAEHDWDLQDALSAFYEKSASSMPGPTSGSVSSQAPSSTTAPSSSASVPTRGASSSANVRSFADFVNSGKKEGGGEVDEDGPDYFAGGEKSGIVMKGQSKKDGKAKNLVKDIMDMAAKAGPPPGGHGHDHDHDDDDDDEEGAFRVQGRGTGPRVQAFVGSGYRLGSEDEPQPPAQPSANPTPTPALRAPTPASRETVNRVLTFWRNGFSVEDGPLLSYEDPQNQELLEHIKSGRAPPSLLNVSIGQPVEVRVQHKLEEDYKAPPKVLKPFQGSGRTLGSIVPEPEATSSGSMPGAFPSSSSSSPVPVNPISGPPVLAVDESQPTTSVQIRLADGTRLVAKFNHTHTIGDLRRFVRSSRPESRSWALQTTFPVKELTEDTLTIKAAGLLNAVVVQKFT